MTKEIRHQIYEKALDIFMNYQKPYYCNPYWYDGLCVAIFEALTQLDMTHFPNPFSRMELYPEIFKHKPKRTYDEYFWFDWTSKGTQKRIDILKQAIEETK